jgi:hypothetical protein
MFILLLKSPSNGRKESPNENNNNKFKTARAVAAFSKAATKLSRVKSIKILVSMQIISLINIKILLLVHYID